VQGDVAAARADADKVARQIQELRQQALSVSIQHDAKEAPGKNSNSVKQSCSIKLFDAR
jgi:hypothetical protein